MEWTWDDLAEHASISRTSVANVIRGQPGVGRKVLEAVGRAVPGWTEDTPWEVLAGEPIPPVVTSDEAVTLTPPTEESVANGDGQTSNRDKVKFGMLTEAVRSLNVMMPDTKGIALTEDIYSLMQKQHQVDAERDRLAARQSTENS
ncbi:hypothetical protein [Actinophytocola sp.]|uniref:hypothetical protein n=1 Tax=Actinophytocola sp. TaxID=1872138 RepID=UPI002D716504|nr:hypothetical protein [Actinophytocola sp.]HYQ69667.1 hypothetical protein [Actinophytocola sp.]